MAVPLQVPPTPILIGQAAMVGASGAINTGETILAKTGPLCATRITLGTVIRVTYVGTCTSTAANVSTFNIYIGPLGTTSDAKVLSCATAAAQTSGTGILFTTTLQLTVTVLGSGTSGTALGFGTVLNTGTTGIATQINQLIAPTMAGFDTTVEGNIISASYLSAASTTTSTFSQCFIETMLR